MQGCRDAGMSGCGAAGLQDAGCGGGGRPLLSVPPRCFGAGVPQLWGRPLFYPATAAAPALAVAECPPPILQDPDGSLPVFFIFFFPFVPGVGDKGPCIFHARCPAVPSGY